MKEWAPTDDWFEESNVLNKIVQHLPTIGYEVKSYNSDKRQHGHDIIAFINGKKLIIEVKGYPSDKYISGIKKGLLKPTRPYLQAGHWFSDALRALIFAKCENWDDSLAFGLPDVKRYNDLIDKIEPLMNRLDCKCFFVDQNGNVRVL